MRLARKKFVIVLGVRPEAITIVPLLRALQRTAVFRPDIDDLRESLAPAIVDELFAPISPKQPQGKSVIPVCGWQP